MLDSNSSFTSEFVIIASCFICFCEHGCLCQTTVKIKIMTSGTALDDDYCFRCVCLVSLR